MVKRIGRRFVSLLLTFVTVLTMLPAMTLPALAATSGTVTGLSDTDIVLSYNGSKTDTWAALCTTITGTAQSEKDSCDKATSNSSTLTITNKKSTPATLSFDYTITANGGTIQVNGTNCDKPGSFSKEIGAHEKVKVEVYIKSGSTSAETKITMTNVKLVADVSATVTFQPAVNGGSYTVDGEAITADRTKTQSSMTAYRVAATPNAGYQFMGWCDTTSGKCISVAPKTELSFDSGCTVTAKFASKELALFEANGQIFDNLGKAVAEAEKKQSAIITLVSSGKITGKYMIPSNVTLLIPFDEGGTLYKDTPGYVDTYNSSRSAFRTMTMAPGSSITVNGAISVGGKHTYQMGKQGPSGPYGQIDMAEGSSITLNNGANLYAWGYITGDGAITAASGSKVYEYFQLRDWRGGTATKSMNDNKEKVFPISQYYVQNIESALTIQSGSQESTYLTVHAKVAGTASAKIDFIGDANSGSLFKIANEGKLTKKYDPETDRITYTTTGSASLESLTLSVAGYNFNSSAYVLPINNNMTLEVLSGRVAVNCDAALLPGAQITIAQGAELNVSSGKFLYVYDLAQWKKGYAYNSNDSGYAPVLYSPTKTGTRKLTNAKIDVNGKLTAIGSVYTTESGANICSSEGTGRFIQTGGPGTGTTTHQCTQTGTNITYVSIPITPAQLKNADGVNPSHTQTKDTKAGDTFIYCKCQDCGDGTWVKDVAAINDSTGKQVTTHNTLQEAVGNLKADQYIKLLHNTTEDINNITKDIYLDLNGRTVTGTFNMGSKTLYGMDSATDTYDGAKAGKIVGNVKGTIAPVFETTLKPTKEYDSLRYVAIKNEDGTEYTFHRFNISVTGYRFELTTGGTPQCALFFIGKFQGDKAAKDYLTSLGFTLKDKKDKQLGKANYEFTAGTVFPDMPAEGKESTSEVVRSGDAYLFEAYLMRSFDKENHNGYTEEIGATAQATFDNGGKQDSETQWLSFEDAWTNPGELDETQQAILDKFLKELGITKQAE
jgi:hypothetical protein